jgi:hypothetical protein
VFSSINCFWCSKFLTALVTADQGPFVSHNNVISESGVGGG